MADLYREFRATANDRSARPRDRVLIRRDKVSIVRAYAMTPSLGLLVEGKWTEIEADYEAVRDWVASD